MNWNTQSTNVTVTELDDCCPHLKVGDLAAARTRENDSFGPVGSYCMCKQCHEEHLKETTPYKLSGDRLFEVVKLTARALFRAAQNNSEFAVHQDALDTAKSVGIKRQKKWPSERSGPAYDYLIYIGDENGEKQLWLLADYVVFADSIMARYNELMGLLSKHLEHEMPGGGWMSLPYQPSRTTEFLILEGCMISPTVARSIEEPGLPAGYRWKSIPEDITVYPVDAYDKVVCNDCKKTLFKKDTLSWKWYDFYPAQGDVPLIVCNSCTTEEKHRARVARDRADCEHEMGEQDVDIDDGGPDYDPNDFDDDDPDRE